ncbi:sialate O-acetylesterase [Acinetobacter baumannii]|uniref:sialate O-acetylesterase n=1 Tax=Acinetobacter baumannii TaxID=470 RepID=UPI003A864BEF
MATQVVIEVPGVPISELEPTSSVSPDDVLPVVQGDQTKKAPLEQVADMVKAGLGSAALKNESDFATPASVTDVATASQNRDDAQNERIDGIEYGLVATRNGTDRSFSTYAAMLAYVPSEANVSVRNNDPDPALRGTYTWTGTEYVPGYDPLDAAISYADGVGEQSTKYTDEKITVIEQEIDQQVEPIANSLYAAVKVDNPIIYPLLLDANNKVILGYDRSEDSIFGAGLISEEVASDISETVANKELANKGVVLVESTGDIYPLLLDVNNKVILGYDRSEDKLIGIGFDQSQNTGELPYKISKSSLNFAMVYGQSLSRGGASGTPISTFQPFYNVMFAGGTQTPTDFSSFVPLHENASEETPCSGLSSYASLCAWKENHINPADFVLMSATAGMSGYKLSSLKKGSTAYNNFINQAQQCFNLNNDTTVQCVAWLQGESNAGFNNITPEYTQDQYLATFLQLVNDANNDIRAINNQLGIIPFLTYQHSTYVDTNITQLAFLRAEKADERVFVIVPTYPFPHNATDHIHLTSIGYKLIGAHLGRAYKQVVHDNIKPHRIRPLSSLIVNKEIRIKFLVPVTPLVLDINTLAATTDYGFAVKDSSGAILPISSVTIENGDTVLLTLANTPTDPNLNVRYAMDYNATQIMNGGTGNLHDSCLDTVTFNENTYAMPYYCPHFEIDVVTGEI